MCYNDIGLRLEEGIIVHKRKDKVISLILVMALLLTGVYLDTAIRDVLFLRSCLGDSIIYSELFQADINDVVACMIKTMNECSGMEQQLIELDPLLYLLCSNHIFSFPGKSFGCLETVQSLWRMSGELVIDYMHQSDGKKRNEQYRVHLPNNVRKKGFIC